MHELRKVKAIIVVRSKGEQKQQTHVSSSNYVCIQVSKIEYQQCVAVT